MIVYRITNNLTNKSYIGKTTKTLEERMKVHFKVMPTSKQFIHRAMMKYGVDEFSWTILEVVTSDIDEKEKYWIKHLNTLSPNGYNLSMGGEGGDCWSSLRRGHTEESKKKISDSMTGKKIPDAVKEKIRMAQVGSTPWNKGIKYKWKKNR